MDRRTVYVGEIPQVEDVLQPQVDVMIALGYALQAVIGSGVAADGLTCSATNPASMSVNVGPGSLTTLTTVDGQAFSTLAADGSPLVKMGINTAASNFALSAPSTPGQAVTYLIEGAFNEYDDSASVLPYFNAANPLQSLSGPGGGGAALPTRRAQRVALQLKAGVPASAGQQVAPAVDPGWTGLWTITVNSGATSIVSGNISRFPGAPFLDVKLSQVTSQAALVQEAETRSQVDQELSEGIASEATTRKNADDALTAALNAEVSARSSIRQGYPAMAAFGTPGVYLFQVPAGVHVLRCTVTGGGGGGVGCSGSTGAGTNGGGAGGAGATAIAFVNVNPGDQVQVTVGSPGVGAGSMGSAGSGGTSSVGSAVSCTGGGGAVQQTGGGGGTVYGGSIGFAGGWGTDGEPGNDAGGLGGASYYGGGGRGGSNGGFQGPAWGSGGGGGYSGPSGAQGGSGAPGLVIIEY